MARPCCIQRERLIAALEGENRELREALEAQARRAAVSALCQAGASPADARRRVQQDQRYWLEQLPPEARRLLGSAGGEVDDGGRASPVS